MLKTGTTHIVTEPNGGGSHRKFVGDYDWSKNNDLDYNNSLKDGFYRIVGLDNNKNYLYLRNMSSFDSDRTQEQFLYLLDKEVQHRWIKKGQEWSSDNGEFHLFATLDELTKGLENKVDKIVGYGLSQEDFTTELRDKLQNLIDVEIVKKLDKGNYVGTAEDLKSDIDHKVDKVDGKQLSTEDFTTALKQKLEALQNADLTDYVTKTLLDEVKTEVGNLKQILKSNNVNLDTIQEIVDFITLNEATLSSLGIDNIAGLQNALNQKADVNHNHDDRYHKKSEITALLTEKANADHNHDDRYYRKTDVDDNFVKLTDSRLTNSRPASDVYDWAKQPNPPKVSYDDLENLPVKGFIGEYDISKFLDIPYNLSLEEGKYWYLQNGRMNHIQIIKGYEGDSPNSIPIAQYQLHFLHNSTQMPNFRWIIKQSNGVYAISNGGSWFQFASTYYVATRSFTHHRINPDISQLNDTIGNGTFTIQDYIIPNFPETDAKNGLVVNFKGSNIFTQMFMNVNGDIWSRGYTNTNGWGSWVNLKSKLIKVVVNTPSATRDKIGTTENGNYIPKEGDELVVDFIEGSWVNSPTLNIDGSGAKNIMLSGRNPDRNNLSISTNGQNKTVRLWYDGTNYQLYGATVNSTYGVIPKQALENVGNNYAYAISGETVAWIRNWENILNKPELLLKTDIKNIIDVDTIDEIGDFKPKSGNIRPHISPTGNFSVFAGEIGSGELLMTVDRTFGIKSPKHIDGQVVSARKLRASVIDSSWVDLDSRNNELNVTNPADEDDYKPIKASGFKTPTGTDNQILLADGGVESIDNFFTHKNNDYYNINSTQINNFISKKSGIYYIGYNNSHSELLLNFNIGRGSTSALQMMSHYSNDARLQVRKQIDNSRTSGGWRELAFFDDIPLKGQEVSYSDWTYPNNLTKNTIFLTGSGNKTIRLHLLENHKIVSFKKCYDGGNVNFVCQGKIIVKRGADAFNGKDGSNAVISIVGNKCYIDINNYE